MLNQPLIENLVEFDLKHLIELVHCHSRAGIIMFLNMYVLRCSLILTILHNLNFCVQSNTSLNFDGREVLAQPSQLRINQQDKDHADLSNFSFVSIFQVHDIAHCFM